ncbi:hypothetical protein ACP275_02G092600 [Erythranthe tilingii]
MSSNTLSLFTIIVLSSCVLYICDGVPTTHTLNQKVELIDQKQVKYFCVANFTNPSATREKMQGFIDYACGKYDCSAIKPNGPCFEPDAIVSHASYALDLVYRATGVCNLDIGAKTIYDRCK